MNNPPKLRGSILLHFIVICGPVNNISKIGQHRSIIMGLNVTSKYMVTNAPEYPISTQIF